MKKIINHLRRQPEETRTHILHVVTIVFAVLLFVLWTYSFKISASNDDKEGIKEDIKPFSVLKNNAIDSYNNIPSPSPSINW